MEETVETTDSVDNNNEQKYSTNSPQTGDDILKTVTALLVSIICLMVINKWNSHL